MPGVILGTAAYMSPEQIKGEPVDQRADVWAFGCVLFEMLTGRRVISGNTNAEALGEVLQVEPNWSLLPVETPQGIRRLLRRCLRKERKDRLQHIGDARLEIGEAHDDSQDADPAAPAITIQKKSLLWVYLALALIVAAAMAVGRAGLQHTPAVDARIYRSLIALPEGLHFAADKSPAGRFALSPDGKILAFVAMDAAKHSSLWVRQLDSLIAQPLSGTDDASFPFWSPDSRHIAFLAQGQLKTIAASGGSPFRVCNAELSATGSWNRDNVILFTPKGGSSLYQVSASGGDTPVPATTLDAANGDIQHWYPFFLPDGRHFLYSSARNRTEGVAEPHAIYVGSLNSKQPPKLLVKADGNAEYAQGYLLFLRGNTLMARAFDPDRLELKGEAAPLAATVQVSAGSVTGTAGAFSTSEAGLLAYQTGKDEVRSQLAWFDHTGKSISVLGDQADYGDVALSQDGQRAAVSVLDPALGTRDLWIYDVATGRRDRLTSDPVNDFEPIWSPNGDDIAYSRQGSSIDLYAKPAAGPGDSARLLEQPGLGIFPMSWSRDGKFILYVAGGAAIARSDLWVMPLFGDKKPFQFLATPSVQNQAQFSPNGKWIAYISNKSGTFEIYVTSFPVRGAEIRVSESGGMWPRWGSDGREIFYLTPDNILTGVTVDEDSSGFRVTAGRPLFRVRPHPQVSLGQYPYAISPNSQRFLVNTFIEETTSMPITLFLNWPEELKK